MLNYFYRVGIASIFEKIAHWIIFICDSLGIEIHFIRFVYWTLLDPKQGENEYVKLETLKTDLMLLSMLTLLYMMAFHFLTKIGCQIVTLLSQSRIISLIFRINNKVSHVKVYDKRLNAHEKHIITLEAKYRD